MAEKLQPTERDEALRSLPAWAWNSGNESISRELKFKSFSEAFGFMARVALLCESADHHPDWRNVYNRVTIVLSTHSPGGLTQKDVDLARAIDGLLG